DRFVEIENHAGYAGVSCKLAHIELRVSRTITFAQHLCCALRIGLKSIQVMVKTIDEDTSLFGFRMARGDEPECKRDALFGTCAAFAYHTLGHGTRSLNVRNVIH